MVTKNDFLSKNIKTNLEGFEPSILMLKNLSYFKTIL